MELLTEVQSNQFPALFDRFEMLFDSGLWRKRANRLREETRGNPYLQKYLLEENSVVIALDNYSTFKAARGYLPRVRIEDPLQYGLIAMISQCLAYLDATDAETSRRFVARVKGCFSNPADMRGLATELLAGSHLLRQGVRIGLPMVDETYDWLAESKGLAFEVECKSISDNKGRQVHLREAIDLAHIIKKELGKARNSLSEGLILDIRVPARMPTGYRERKEIAEQVRKAVLTAQDVQTDIVRVSQQSFPRAELQIPANNPDPEPVRAFLEARIGEVAEVHAMAETTRAGGILLQAIGSQTPDDLIGEMMRTLRIAASNQLTGTRPGVLCAKLEGINARELVEVAQMGDETPSALRVGVSGLLDSQALRHVAWVVFMADGDVEHRDNGAHARAGITYAFPNSDCMHSNDERLRLFGIK